jgi:hypothetical protein
MSDMSGMIGHNQPPRDHATAMSVEERSESIRKQITLWVGNLRLDAALAADELGQYSGLQKALLLRNGLIVGAVRHCRLNPRADSRMSILTLITFLADNNEGICRLSINRMCEVLKRSRQAIVTGIQDLETDGQIGVVRKDGMPNCYWPLIPAALAELSANPVWFVDGLSSKPKFRSFGSAEAAITSVAAQHRSIPPDQFSRVDRSSRVDPHRSTPVDEPVNSSRPTSQLQSNSISLSISPSNNAAARRRAAPRTRLPGDWKPSPVDAAWVLTNFEADQHRIAIEAEKFCNHHHAKGSTMADWPAAWRSWWGTGFHKIPRRAKNVVQHLEAQVDAVLNGPQGAGLIRQYGREGARKWIKDTLTTPSSSGGAHVN